MADRRMEDVDPRVMKAAIQVALRQRGKPITNARVLRQGQVYNPDECFASYATIHHSKGPECLKPGDCIDARYRLIRIDDTGDRWVADDLRTRHEVLISMAERAKAVGFLQQGDQEVRLLLDNGEAIPEVSIAGDWYFIDVLDPKAMMESMLAWRGEIHLEVVPRQARIEISGQVFTGEARATDLPSHDYPVRITCPGYQDEGMSCQPKEARRTVSQAAGHAVASSPAQQPPRRRGAHPAGHFRSPA